MNSRVILLPAALAAMLSLVEPACAQRNLNVAAAAANEQRVALVIGNSAYKVDPLRNPANDAEDVAAALRALGFRVTLRKDASHRQMIAAVNEFGQELKKGGVGLFYYAGHGVQSRGRNYLIPVGAKVDGEADLEFESVDANRVLAYMEDAGNRVNIVILDACRNNPYARSFRSASRGLAQMEAAKGSYLAFATAPGSVAADGSERNGLYTQHLLASLRQPDSDIDKVFRRVTAEVSRTTGGKQVPWVSSSLTGDFYFRPGASSTQVGSSAPAAEIPPAQTVVATPAAPAHDLPTLVRTMGSLLREAGTIRYASVGPGFNVKFEHTYTDLLHDNCVLTLKVDTVSDSGSRSAGETRIPLRELDAAKTVVMTSDEFLAKNRPNENVRHVPMIFYVFAEMADGSSSIRTTLTGGRYAGAKSRSSKIPFSFRTAEPAKVLADALNGAIASCSKSPAMQAKD